jgi:uncharacterized membrane protein YdcZ (DUF606 family)
MAVFCSSLTSWFAGGIIIIIIIIIIHHHHHHHHRWLYSPAGAMASSFTRFLDHTQRRATVGKTPLDE